MTTEQVQLLLRYLGYAPGEADGILGEKTREAIREFQRAEGLEADGIAGSRTQAMLREAVFQNRPRKADGAAQSFWKDIRYFSRSEPYIACSCGKCGGFPAEPTEKLMRLADRIRAAAGAPMIPSSTVRCRAHNAVVGGVSNSRHLTGCAMDFSIRGWSSAKTLALVQQQSQLHYAYAIDESHVHMDVTP